MQRLKRLVLRGIEASGLDLYRSPSGRYTLQPKLRLSKDPFKDVASIIGECRRIFDVGAHVGQTTRRLVKRFPEATVFSFEPDPDSFKALERASPAGVQCHSIALGSKNGAATLHRYGLDQTNSLLRKSPEAERYVVDSSYFANVGEVPVRVSTLDTFCEEHNVPGIDFLKIDAQGYELEVLKGASRMLGKPIPAIYLEINFVRYYVGQPLFQEVYEFLYQHGYRLVGIYESGMLTHYYQVGGNALFIHESFGPRRERRSVRVGPVTISC